MTAAHHGLMRRGAPARTGTGRSAVPRIRAHMAIPPSPGVGFDFGSISVFPPGDKITQQGRAKADQSIGAVSIVGTNRGLVISADADGLVSSTEFPDGFRWLQTVTTNDPSNTPVGAPLLPTPITYVDPIPNDDTKPFYWTDAQEARNVGHFADTPGRPAHPTGTIVWDAVLSIGGVNTHDVTRFDSLTYGFSIDPAGVVTTRGPASPAGVGDHIATLSAEFPAWTFK
jgi:hypothetical protein